MEDRYKCNVVVLLILMRKLNENTEILLQKKYNTGYLDDTFDLIGGYTEKEESLTMSMKREIQKEIGINIKEEKARLQNEKTKLEAEVARGEKMLSNQGFLSKAPESKVNEEKEKLEKYKEMLKNVIERINNI